MKKRVLRWFYAVAVVLFLVMSGCKRSENQTSESQPAAGPSPSEIAAAVDTATKEMQSTSFESLSNTHLGQECVVVTHSPHEDARVVPPPPPLGMVHRMGQTTIFKAELNELSSDSLKIRAPYPTSGNYKVIEISRDDIQSIHLSK